MVVHAGMAYYLPRAVGTARALELLWTSRSVPAEQAREIGLVSEVFPAEELMPATLQLASQVATGPTITVELDKKVIYDAMANDDLRQVLQNEMWASSVARQTEDSQEGMRSFIERREPVFRGR
jgi:enoyl-CoA hydratase/carnithine racemase